MTTGSELAYAGMRRRSSCKAKWKDVDPPPPPPQSSRKTDLGQSAAQAARTGLWRGRHRCCCVAQASWKPQATPEDGDEWEAPSSAQLGCSVTHGGSCAQDASLGFRAQGRLFDGIQIPSLRVHREDIAARRRSSLASASTSVGELSTAAFSEP